MKTSVEIHSNGGLIEAKSIKDYQDNLRKKYGDNWKNKPAFYQRFDGYLSQIKIKFSEKLGYDIDPVEALYDMYFLMKYSCGDISDILKSFGINYKSDDIIKHTKIYLGWKKRDKKKAGVTSRRVERSKKNHINNLKRSRKHNQDKETVIKSLRKIKKEREFNIATYKLCKNINCKVAYILGLDVDEYKDWVRLQEKETGIKATAAGIQDRINQIITEEGLGIDKIKYNQARVSEIKRDS